MNQLRHPENPLLLVDDEQSWLQSLSFALKSSAGLNHLLTCDDSSQVMTILNKIEVSVILLDLNMPHLSGKDLLEQIVQDHPQIPVIILSGMNQLETAVSCIKLGAFDYFVKTAELDRIIHGLEHALSFRALQEENLALRQHMQSDVGIKQNSLCGLNSLNPQMIALFNYIRAIAASREPVLITGESGVGKELFAEAVHSSSCSDGPWVTVNTAGLDDNLFADTLFGHIKGGFTGADQNRAGMIEQASGGSLFLDEIGDLSLASQVKLLRFLQSGEYYPVGSDRPKQSTARLLFATNQDLSEKMTNGLFRKDLYYRLKSHLIEVPPLRQRKEDLPLLLDFFLKEAANSQNKKCPTPPPELIDLLASYDFPGNVRELRAMVYNAVSTHRSRILSMKSFKQAISHSPPEGKPTQISTDEISPPELTFGRKLPTLKSAAEQLVIEAMKRATGNQTNAARLLGITQPSLNRRLKNLNRG